MQLREAAEVLGVHYQTAYAWVRQGVLPARKTGRGYEVSESDVRALAARRASGTAPRPNIRVRAWAAQAGRLHAAIMSGDETLARHLFDRLARGVPLTELCERVLSPALYRIGEDWAAGTETIAAEHRASAICERLIAAHARQPQGGQRGIRAAGTRGGGRNHAVRGRVARAHRAARRPPQPTTPAGPGHGRRPQGQRHGRRPGGGAELSGALAGPRTPRSPPAARLRPPRRAARPAASSRSRRARPRRRRSCRSIPTGCTPARRGPGPRPARWPASPQAGWLAPAR